MHTFRLMTASLAVAATTAALVAAPSTADPATITGSAQIFMVNPVQSSGDQDLADNKDANSPELAAQYTTEALRNLDGSGTLTGRWVHVKSNTGTPARSTTNEFVYTRDQVQFEHLLAWLGRALETTPDADAGLRRAESVDGLVVIVLHEPDDPRPTVTLNTPAGVFHTPDYRLEIAPT